ncbi:hypothetical protein ACFQXB_02975 [Plastorhodobacter daqingensis]|uniref:SGNH hydrolase-type esterase domain-containing protein n=1 Tax=Plastorhodobacter daqingensis TaxID=1387281 RepID=A0ABW2UIL2_9RHOB
MFLAIGASLTGLAVQTASRRHRIRNLQPPVVAWGDSLTAGAGVTGAGRRYPAVASGLFTPPRTILNEGIGGQTSTQIAARQGAVPILVTATGPLPLRLAREWDFSGGLQGWMSRAAANPPAQVRTENGALVIEALGTPQTGAQVWLGETLPQGTVCTVEFDIDLGGGGWVEVGLANAPSAGHASGDWSATLGFSSGGRKSLTFTVGTALLPTANSLLVMPHTRVGTYRIRDMRISTRSQVGLGAKSVNVLTNSGAFSGSINGSIGGVSGTITTDAAGNWTFARSTPGPRVTLAADSVFVPEKSVSLRDHDAWIWAGRNNFSDPARVKADIAAMVAHLGHGRFLVGAVLPSANDTASGVAMIQALNADLAAAYGVRFVNLVGALQAAGDGTAGDASDIAAGRIPRSLRSDAIHLNDAGYAVVATAMAAADQGTA